MFITVIQHDTFDLTIRYQYLIDAGINLDFATKGSKRTRQGICNRTHATTADFGQIVFNLVDYGLMGKQESDRREDFQEVYDFSEVFELRPLFYFCPDENDWRTSYVERNAVAEES